MRISPTLLAMMASSLAACAPGLSDPQRFGSDEVCDFDVQEDLLIPRCATSGCHVPYQPAAGLEFVTGGLAERLMRSEATTCGGHLLIDPANPSASFLLERVGESPECDGTPTERMPLVGEPLSERELACLTAWVESAVAERREGGVPPAPDAAVSDAAVTDAGAADAGPTEGVDAGP